MNLWALRDWDHWQASMEQAAWGARPWSDRQGAFLADIDAFVVVAPPATGLRT